MHAIGVGPGDEVITPSFNNAADFQAIRACGADPVFVDINLNNLSFDLDKLENSITDKTRAIFVTHVLGLNAISDRLLKICEDNIT